eukprot:6550200-Prymnesium_polylepis.1
MSTTPRLRRLSFCTQRGAGAGALRAGAGGTASANDCAAPPGSNRGTWAHEAANNVGDRAFFFYAAVAKNVLVEVDEQIGCWTGASQQGRRNSLTTLPGGLYAGEAWLGYRKQYGRQRLL